MPDLIKPEVIYGENAMDEGVLLLAVFLKATRLTLGYSLAGFAEKLALTLDQYKKLEEGEHGPDTEKTLALLDGGLHFKRVQATTRIPRDVVRLLFPKNGEDRE
jgi:hypothetical protein